MRRPGMSHRTPVTADTLTVLEEARRENPGIGDAPLLPAPKDPLQCVSRWLAREVGRGRGTRSRGSSQTVLQC